MYLYMIELSDVIEKIEIRYLENNELKDFKEHYNQMLKDTEI